ncbi:VPLPA-CTERM sorting domain-containing protein [Tateyamaria sp.]|uniref:VPLPA-CTERM sorting domain-containing protein n=1 Tax=Tateyamaria sp. TaxID=1929288 RepID=UPI0032A0A880
MNYNCAAFFLNKFSTIGPFFGTIFEGNNMYKTLTAAAGLSIALAGAAAATPSLDFIIDGNTFTQPFSFTNNSTGGEQIVGFGINLAGTDLVFDTATGGIPNSTIGVPFTPVGGSGVTTGLIGAPSVPDGATVFSIAFNDFGVGESFQFDIDVDGASGSPVTVPGNLMIGATAFADFSDGQRVTGIFAAITGNSDASGFMATGITQTPAVPLPAAGWMLLAGLGGLGVFGRRKRS